MIATKILLAFALCVAFVHCDDADDVHVLYDNLKNATLTDLVVNSVKTKYHRAGDIFDANFCPDLVNERTAGDSDSWNCFASNLMSWYFRFVRMVQLEYHGVHINLYTNKVKQVGTFAQNQLQIAKSN